MPTETQTRIAQLLHAWTTGDKAALHALAPLVYQEAHRIASTYMRREKEGHTLTPAALVSEAFVRIAAGNPVPATSYLRFLGLIASVMRRILVDQARYGAASKRPESTGHAIFFDESLFPSETPHHIALLQEALAALTRVDARKAHVVELHYFGGMSYEEIGTAFGVSERTVARDIRAAESWLRHYLTTDD